MIHTYILIEPKEKHTCNKPAGPMYLSIYNREEVSQVRQGFTVAGIGAVGTWWSGL